MIDQVVAGIVRRNPYLKRYPYYGIIGVVNPTSTALYQHEMTFPRKPGMTLDYRDLRFFQPDGTELPYWLDPVLTSTTAPKLYANVFKPGQKFLYLFYGNRDAVAKTNGTDTFDFFEDWNALSWTIWRSANQGLYSVTGGQLNMALASSGTYMIQTNATFSGYEVHVRMLPSTASCQTYVLFTPVGTVSWNDHMYHYGDSYTAKIGATGNTTYATSLYGVFLRYIYKNPASGTAYMYIYNDAMTALQKSHSGSPTYRTSAIGAFAYNSGYGRIDFIFLKKYVPTEPTSVLLNSGLRNPGYTSPARIPA
jgi:hypothetical protein